MLDKFVHGSNCQTGPSFLKLEVLEFSSAFLKNVFFKSEKKKPMEKDSGYFWNIVSLQGVLTVKKIKKEEGHKKGRHD